MNTFSTKINAMFFATVIMFAPISASENVSVEAQQQTVIATQESVVWCKKRSTQVVAALAAATVGLYVLAVYKDKVASPAALFAALAGMCSSKKNLVDIAENKETKTDAQVESNSNNEQEDTADVNSQDQQKPVVHDQKDQSATDVSIIGKKDTTTLAQDNAEILPTDFSAKFSKGMETLGEIIKAKKESFADKNGLFINQYV
jgi:hypothetical protein